jgi:HEAT repeat protein
VATLSEIPDPEVRGELFALAGDRPDPPVLAIASLTARGADVVPALLSALREDSLGGVAAARILDILVTIDPQAALSPALRGIRDPRSHVRHAARETLGQIPGSEATEALSQLAADPSSDAGSHARILLGNRGLGEGRAATPERPSSEA